jgi:hypothetical protein
MRVTSLLGNSQLEGIRKLSIPDCEKAEAWKLLNNS